MQTEALVNNFCDVTVCRAAWTQLLVIQRVCVCVTMGEVVGGVRGARVVDISSNTTPVGSARGAKANHSCSDARRAGTLSINGF